MKKYWYLYPFCILLLFVDVFPAYSHRAGEVSYIKEQLLQKIYPIDSEASAVVLYEKTTATVFIQSQRWSQATRTYKMIKILKPSAIKHASISLKNVYGTLSENYSVDHIEGYTYNLINGSVDKSTLSRDAIYRKRISASYSEVDFDLPNVKEGSIIEFSYEITVPLSYQLSPWTIQEENPKLCTEYAFTVPKSFNYTSVTQGGISFTDIKKPADGEDVSELSYHALDEGLATNTYSVLWGQKNVPALTEEPYISCLENHIRRMDLMLSRMNIGSWLDDQKILNNWEMLDKTFLDKEQYDRKTNKITRLVKQTTDSLVEKQPSQLAKAQAIYNFLRYFNCTGPNDPRSEKEFNDVITYRKGTEAEINLLLTAMLRYAGLTASPVVLSRLGGLRSHAAYPMLNRLNYLVCRLKIDSTSYCLDASDQNNPFGVLPLFCYNGYARVIDNPGEGIYLTSNDIREKKVIILNISCITDSFTSIAVTEKMGIFESANFRRNMQKDSLYLDKYLEKNTQGFTGVPDIIDPKAYNVDSPDTYIVLKYKTKVKNKKADVIYLKTDYVKKFTTNPFIALHRSLPIEFPCKNDFVYVMNLTVPDGYTVSDVPEPAVLSYENDQLLFKHTVIYDNAVRHLSVTASFTAGNTIFKAEEYATLRSFFEKMIQEQSTAVTIERKKK